MRRSDETRLVMGVDVGSGSVRAGVFDAGGRLLGRDVRPIGTHTPMAEHYEQSSEEIWAAIIATVRGARQAAGVGPERVAGLCFDATSSVALFDRDGRPATVSTGGADRWNIVMWCDHRAVEQALAIDATGHPALQHVGGSMSPEMVLPKLMWLRRHLPDAWARYGLALDLTDFLAWRATGRVHASACTVTCKWAHRGHLEPGWPADLLGAIGLADIGQRLGVPATALPVGAPVGRLAGAAAAELGLTADCVVATGMIDAHAGCLAPLAALPATELNRHLVVIGGTSNCHMAVSPEPRFVPGVWGPYWQTLLPGLWLNEGGQSATGALLQHVLDWHAAAASLPAPRHAALDAALADRCAAPDQSWRNRLLVLPDFNGNRSPLARPSARGMVWGLGLDHSFDSLVDLYYAAAVGVVLGTRHVIAALNRHGYAIDRLFLSGGHAQSRFLAQLYADATGCAVAPNREGDGVLLGDAILAAVAAGLYPNAGAAARAMTPAAEWLNPNPALELLFERQYAAFLALHESNRQIEGIMNI